MSYTLVKAVNLPPLDDAVTKTDIQDLLTAIHDQNGLINDLISLQMQTNTILSNLTVTLSGPVEATITNPVRNVIVDNPISDVSIRGVPTVAIQGTVAITAAEPINAIIDSSNPLPVNVQNTAIAVTNDSQEFRVTNYGTYHSDSTDGSLVRVFKSCENGTIGVSGGNRILGSASNSYYRSRPDLDTGMSRVYCGLDSLFTFNFGERVVSTVNNSIGPDVFIRKSVSSNLIRGSSTVQALVGYIPNQTTAIPFYDDWDRDTAPAAGAHFPALTSYAFTQRNNLSDQNQLKPPNYQELDSWVCAMCMQRVRGCSCEIGMDGKDKPAKVPLANWK